MLGIVTVSSTVYVNYSKELSFKTNNGKTVHLKAQELVAIIFKSKLVVKLIKCQKITV